MQKHVNLVDLVKSFPTNIFLQNLASIQKRTSPVKFARLAEKSWKGSKLRTFQPRFCDDENMMRMIAEASMQLMDMDGDGVLSFEEFRVAQAYKEVMMAQANPAGMIKDTNE